MYIILVASSSGVCRNDCRKYLVVLGFVIRNNDMDAWMSSDILHDSASVICVQ